MNGSDLPSSSLGMYRTTVPTTCPQTKKLLWPPKWDHHHHHQKSTKESEKKKKKRKKKKEKKRYTYARLSPKPHKVQAISCFLISHFTRGNRLVDCTKKGSQRKELHICPDECCVGFSDSRTRETCISKEKKKKNLFYSQERDPLSS